MLCRCGVPSPIDPAVIARVLVCLRSIQLGNPAGCVALVPDLVNYLTAWLQLEEPVPGDETEEPYLWDDVTCD